MKGYPLFLVGLEKRRCVVVGGGSEAERKVEGLLECDAATTVIAQDATERIRRLAADRRLTWIEREYRSGDLKSAFLVIAERANDATNTRIWNDARSAGALVNVMDDVEHCDFIAGSVIRRGPLTVAISTGGCAPALAVRLRERLQKELGPEYATFLEMMRSLREPMMRRYPDFDQRRTRWYELVDSDIIEHLRAGRTEQARGLLERSIG
jgi:precorrin-2 dehydrogenase/sirohydrochlorin ferrochelatase